MLEQQPAFRIREGAFVFLLAAGPAATIERRQHEGFEPAGGESDVLCAWHRAGGERAPVLRLAGLLQCPAADWGQAIVFAAEARPVAVAAEHISRIPETGKPVIQRFNPAGVLLDGGPLIHGVCPHTEPEHLVLETASLGRCLQRAAGREAGR